MHRKIAHIVAQDVTCSAYINICSMLHDLDPGIHSGNIPQSCSILVRNFCVPHHLSTKVEKLILCSNMHNRTVSTKMILFTLQQWRRSIEE